MYILQRRDSDNSLWHTCSQKGRKCRFDVLPAARVAYRVEMETEDYKKHPTRQLRIFDSSTNTEVD